MLELEIQKISACSFLSNVLPLSLVRLLIYNKTSEANRLFCLTFAVCFVQQNLAQTNVFWGHLYVFVLFDVFQRLFQAMDTFSSEPLARILVNFFDLVRLITISSERVLSPTTCPQ